MTIDGLVNEQGSLAETFAKFDPKTIQHSDEICADRISDKKLRNKWFWTADGAVYTVEDDGVILYSARREENPILKNIEEATKQLIHKQNYVPKQEDLEAAINSKNTLRIKLSDLELIKDNDEYSHFEINTSEYNRLNETQRAYAERVFRGEGKFKEYMKTLSGEGKETVNIYVLTPEYVKTHVEKGKALARACGLDGFDCDSRFVALGRFIDNSYIWLRGVPKDVAEGDDKKSEEDKYSTSYKTLLSDPQEAAKRMTPDVAAGISNILTTYLKNQKE